MSIIYIKYNKFTQRKRKIIPTVHIKTAVASSEDMHAYDSKS